MLEDALLALSRYLTELLWIAPMLSLLAGALTAFTPCSLANLPLVLFYVGNTAASDRKTTSCLCFYFALGNALSFLLMGFIAIVFGNLVLAYMRYFYLLLGLLMIIMALQLWELYECLAPANIMTRVKSKGNKGAFFLGGLGGVFASPCATPVLAAILSILAVKGSFLWGMLLMSCYALGNGFVLLLIGRSIASTVGLLHNESYKRLSWYVQELGQKQLEKKGMPKKNLLDILIC